MGTARGPKALTDRQKRLRHIVAQNVMRLADRYYFPKDDPRYSEREFAARLSLGATSLRNIITESNGCSIDTLQTIADAVGIEVWELTMPPADPPPATPKPRRKSVTA